MRPWLINTSIIFFTIFFVTSVNPSITKPLLFIIVIISAIWAYNDAKKLEIEKYKKTALTPSNSPSGVGWIVLIIWIIAFPMYISYRKKILDGKIPLQKTTEKNT